MDSEEAFGEEVRQALRRVDAPEHFAERLQARMAATPQEPATVWARWLAVSRLWRLAGLTAVVLILLAAGVRTERLLQQRRAQVAEAQFNQALQVTGRALDHIANQLGDGQVGAISQALKAVPGEQR